MQKNNFTISFIHKHFFLFLSIVIIAVVCASFLWTRAAFVEPTVAPASSVQDFAQNIMGANSVDNAFDSSSVVASSSGSIIERLEYMTDLYITPPACELCETCDSIDYSIFKNQIWDDWKASAVSSSGDLATAYAATQDMNKEEGVWTSETDASLGSETIASGEVWLDARTGLYWSDCFSAAQDATCDTITNSFTLNGVVADADDGLDAEGGLSVDFCEALSLDADGDTSDETDWYLPSQKELMMAYINGAANNIPVPAFSFWSSTENYTSVSNAWFVNMAYGSTSHLNKALNLYARCVRR